MDKKKYSVSYTSGATGFGWRQEYDRLDEFEEFINEKRKDYTADVSVWDETLQDFIFWKKALTYEPTVDMLADYSRDMRTVDRKFKYKAS